jgi:hypothetical protein
MKKYIFLFLLVAPGMVFCQEVKQKQLTISWGAGNLVRQDIIFSPMIHRDFSMLNFSVGYKRKKGMVQNLEASFSSFNPALTDGSYFEDGEEKTMNPHTFSFISIYYGFGKQITKNEKSVMDAGIFFQPDIHVLNYAYGRTGPYFGYFASFGFGVSGNIRYQVNNSNWLEAELRLPVAAWISRSPYLVNDDEFIENTASHNSIKTFLAFIEDGNLAWWNRWQKAGFLVQYHHHFTSRISAGAGYRFSALHHAEPRNLLSFENYFTLNVNYNF